MIAKIVAVIFLTIQGVFLGFVAYFLYTLFVSIPWDLQKGCEKILVERHCEFLE